MEVKYPFGGIVGQEKAKKALLLNIINPKIGGVLFSGEKGTGKTTLIRGICGVVENLKIYNLPLNITEDRLIGGINIEDTLSQGKMVYKIGIIAQANKNILYIDEVNLLSDYIINLILEVSSSKESDFILVGSMNPEEGELRNQFLEKFGLYVNLEGSKYIDERIEIIKRRLDFEKNPLEFYKKYKLEEEILNRKIQNSKELLKKIKLGDEIINLALRMIVEGNIQGNNVEIILLETAKSIAAYEGRTYINIEDIKEASEFVLTHRVREKKQSSNQKKQEDNNEKNIDESLKKDIPQEISKEKKKNENNDEFQYSIGKTFKVQKLEIDDFKRKRLLGSGKRCKTISDSLKGRYIKSIIPKGKVKDLAFDATLRAAAPYQNIFKNKKLAIVIKKEHIREKVREKRVGVSILFTVDASGSMGANKRMVAVKGAILSLLKDAYEKRDRVGMVSFRRDRAEELLPITRSIELASKNLEKLSTGGNTPLYKGLEKSYTLLKNEIKKNPKVIPVLVLITDGKINTSKGESFEKLLKLCNFIKNDGIKSIVIDSEIGRIKLNMAKEICKNLDGKYYKLEDLKRDSLSCIVRENI